MKVIASFSLALCFLTIFLMGNAFAQGSAIPHVGANKFDALIGKSKPVLIQFDATWCPYCKAMQPHLQAFAKKRGGEIDVFRIDIDDEPDIAAEYDIHGLPTLIIFKNGKTVGRYDGVANASELSDWVDDVIR